MDPPDSSLYIPHTSIVKRPTRADVREAREAALRSAMSDSSSSLDTSTSTILPIRASSSNISTSIPQPASLSRSKSSRAELRASADALLRASQTATSTINVPKTTPFSRTVSAHDTVSTSSVPLPPRPATVQSASLSRSKASRTSLHNPASSSPCTVSGPPPAPLSGSLATHARRSASAPLASQSLSKSSLARPQVSADDMLRASLTRNSATAASSDLYNTLPDSLSLTKKRISKLSSTAGSTGGSPPPYSPPPGDPALRIGLADQKSWVRRVEREAAEERANTPSRATNGLFKTAVSVDLMFLIDCTGSMQAYITTVKEQVLNIVEDAKRAFLNQSHTEVFDFTPDIDRVKEFVGSLRAEGGRDTPEDVLGGIQKAINASWQQKTRCMIHIADAPPHGRGLHDLSDNQDDYSEPGSEPHSLTYRPLIQRMVSLKINYALLQITNYTDRMACEFGKIYQSAQSQVHLHRSNRYHTHSTTSERREDMKTSHAAALQFEELQLGTSFEALRHLVAVSVTRSVTRSAGALSRALSRTGSATRSTGSSYSGVRGIAGKFLGSVREEEEEEGIEDGYEESVQVPVESSPPQWDAPDWFDLKIAVKGQCPDISRHTTDTLGNMMMQDGNIQLGFIQLEIQARSKPFGQGAMRTASYARTAASNDHFVIKHFKTGDKGLASMTEEMKGQALCKSFALEFNSLVDPKYSLDFVVTAALQPLLGSGASISIEPFIDGAYVKYNSNGAYVNEDLPDDPCNQAAQAFSHFTFERSWGRFLVCDLQGVGNMLTDPSIQTKDEERFKLCDGNMNSEGFKFFFSTHVCNAICRKLRLKSTGLMLIEEKFEFREEWPGVRSRVYCSNKLCRRILREDSSGKDGAHKSTEFPGHYWCFRCFPQLISTMHSCICAEASPAAHDFQFSSFFYESQGQAAPLQCPEHTDHDSAGSIVGSSGGGLWARLQAANSKEFVSGR
ncbi:hypothetical protein NPX13_g5333 [Xylaria arbuscula]|uniref:Alpha-type protein kinase domain-containing protein n=1 Tax=Xylaria arbuscula TaxID=114810 RepID=A0A9W8NEP0_9PEZI|nr:hypothetical protein NPX13_g5333 [Xylaria arbuscula]